MYLDFEDYHPDIPRVPSPISVREGVLLSLVGHLLLLVAYLITPKGFFDAKVEVVPVQQNQEPLRFVDVAPLNDKSLKALLKDNPSDLDRRATTVERPPAPDNTNPFSRGNTPEFVEGGPKAQPQPQPSAPPSPPGPPAAAAPSPDSAPALDMPSKVGVTAASSPAASPTRATGQSLRDSLRNLSQYVRSENYDNLKGGNADQSADIQFDSMGVDFGPWLRRFKNQVERNWIVPSAAMTYRGRVVIQFFVLRNGTITDLNVIQPAGFPSLTSSSLNALKLSNPTAQLPPEYPAEKVFFTVTFHYNEDPRTLP
jgi:TonB family protein